MQKTAAQSTGQSGKRVAILVILSMLIVGAILGYALWIYSCLDAARLDTAAAWRSLATQLDSRYRAIERQMIPADGTASTSELAAESTPINRFDGQLRMALDGFRTTAQINSQRSASDLIELLLVSEDAPEAIALAGSPELDAAVDQFNANLVEERRILNTPGGQLLDVFLEFPRHAAFQPAYRK